MQINDLIKGNKNLEKLDFQNMKQKKKQLSKEGQNPDILFYWL